MKSNLRTYLRDHLAGAAFAIDLLRSLQKQSANESMRRFVLELTNEIEADKQTLESIARDIGCGRAGVKERFSRWMETFSRLKFFRSRRNCFGLFEAFEVIALGILGKQALWEALSLVDDPRLRREDLAELKRRAVDQHARVEAARLGFARPALAGMTECEAPAEAFESPTRL